jgi:hypothetical protein
MKGTETSLAEKAKFELNSTCLRISNNSISTLDGLPEVLDHVMDAPVRQPSNLPHLHRLQSTPLHAFCGGEGGELVC